VSRPLSDDLDEATPNKRPNGIHELPAGKAFGLLPVTELVTVATNVATLSRPAKAILAAFATAGTSTGAKTPVPGGSPTAGQVGIGPTGTAVFNGTDAVTQAEVTYFPAEGDEYEEEVDVTSNVGTPLSSKRGVVLLEAEALVGGSVGAKTVVARAGTPSAGQAALNLAGNVAFAGADAVTRARIRYLAFPGIGSAPAGVGANLEREVEY